VTRSCTLRCASIFYASEEQTRTLLRLIDCRCDTASPFQLCSEDSETIGLRVSDQRAEPDPEPRLNDLGANYQRPCMQSEPSVVVACACNSYKPQRHCCCLSQLSSKS